MNTKLVQSLFTLVLLAGIVAVRPQACEAWSLPNPFGWGSSSEKKVKQSPARAAKKPPSTWDKLAAGTKSFFNKTGEALGLKKPAKKGRPQYAYAKPRVAKRRKPESKSWFDWMKPEEPKRPKTVNDWMGSTEQVHP